MPRTISQACRERKCRLALNSIAERYSEHLTKEFNSEEVLGKRAEWALPSGWFRSSHGQLLGTLKLPASPNRRDPDEEDPSPLPWWLVLPRPPWLIISRAPSSSFASIAGNHDPSVSDDHLTPPRAAQGTRRSSGCPSFARSCGQAGGTHSVDGAQQNHSQKVLGSISRRL